MKPRIRKNRANPEHMTSFVVPTIPAILFVVMSMIKLGIPASKRHAIRTMMAGKICLRSCFVVMFLASAFLHVLFHVIAVVLFILKRSHDEASSFFYLSANF